MTALIYWEDDCSRHSAASTATFDDDCSTPTLIPRTLFRYEIINISKKCLPIRVDISQGMRRDFQLISSDLDDALRPSLWWKGCWWHHEENSIALSRECLRKRLCPWRLSYKYICPTIIAVFGLLCRQGGIDELTRVSHSANAHATLLGTVTATLKNASQWQHSRLPHELWNLGMWV